MNASNRHPVNQFPKISIVTPSFNQGKFLDRAIRSVLEQEYPNLEYIIMDGGSRDESPDIIRKYAKSLFYWQSCPDEGQSSAINQGMARASGQILAWLNSDDMLMPGALEYAAAELGETLAPTWLIGGSRILDKNGKIKYIRRINPMVNRERILNWHKSWFSQPSVFWNRSMWEASGPLDDNIHFAQDYDLWLRMIDIAEPLTTARVLSQCCFHGEAKGFLSRWDVANSMVRIYKHQTQTADTRKRIRFASEVYAKCLWDHICDGVGNMKKMSGKIRASVK